MSRSPLAELVDLCRHLGKDLFLVQAGGGNISVKTGKDSMIIKASGVRLSDVGARRGWAEADAKGLREGLRKIADLASPAGRDRTYAKLLTRVGKTPGWRVSMESGFHALLPDRVVAHVHSLAGVLLGFLPEAAVRKKITNALGCAIDVYLVPVCVPGADLTLRMRGRKRADRPCLWILKNHGIVWGAQTAGEVRALSARFERAFRYQFGLSRYETPRWVKSGSELFSWNVFRWPECRFDLRPLFPDFVVYFSLWGRGKIDLLQTSPRSLKVAARDAKSFRTKSETLFAHAVVSTAAHQCGLPLRRLPRGIIRAIDRLETERLRVKQAESA